MTLTFQFSLEKTEWATDIITFLGIVIVGRERKLVVPEEKRLKAKNMILEIVRRKATIKQLETLTGLLNFINKAIVPGRAFTRRMYSKFTNLKDNKGNPLKQHHHVCLDLEFRLDCEVWLNFLESTQEIARPWIDFSRKILATKLKFFTDASLRHGIGCVFGTSWSFAKWETGFIENKNPSIEFAELYTLVTGILIWQKTSH